MPRAQAPRLASGRSKYQERYDREKASGAYACQEFLCDFHGPSTARLGQHNRLSSRTDRWSCQTCHGWWCSSRSATHHRCEPPGHHPHNGPATPVTTRVNVQNHIQTLPQATINAIKSSTRTSFRLFFQQTHRSHSLIQETVPTASGTRSNRFSSRLQRLYLPLLR